MNRPTWSRPTKNLVTATQRLATAMGYDLERHGRRWLLRDRANPDIALEKPPAALFAFLAQEAMMSRAMGGSGLSPEEVQDRIGWIGSIPARGLSGWQETTLLRLRRAAP